MNAPKRNGGERSYLRVGVIKPMRALRENPQGTGQLHFEQKERPHRAGAHNKNLIYKITNPQRKQKKTRQTSY